MIPTSEELDWILQRFIAKNGAVPLSWLRHPAIETYAKKFISEQLGIDVETDSMAYSRSIWSLVRRGLAFVGMESESPLQWRVCLTGRGYDVVNGQEVTPEDPTGYMERLLREVPDTTEVVQMYLREALRSYADGSYLASSVMLGVAAEACTLETADHFVKWAGSRTEKLRQTLESKRIFYVEKLTDFQKCLAVEKPNLPRELADALDLDVTAVLQLIRMNRNDAGHPTGKAISRDDCYSRLCIYAGVHKKLHGLKAFFLAPQP